MRTSGSSTATLLPLLLYLTTRSVTVSGKCITSMTSVSPTQIALEEATLVNHKNDREKRANVFLVTRRPSRINNEILSLVNGQSDIQAKTNVPSTYDQQVDQSQMAIINGDDMENIEHVLSIVEYEPQKINKKQKRKTAGITSNNPDSTIASSQNAEHIVPDIGNIYYEVPRTAQLKTVVTPQYYAKPSHESQRSVDAESKLQSREIEYVYPVPAPAKVSRPRFSKNHPLLNPPTSLTEEPKHESSPNSRVPSLHRTHSLLSAETRRPKNYAEQIDTTTPSSDSYSTRPTRRRKNRQRVVDKTSNEQVTGRFDDNANYADAAKPRSIEGRKPRRPSSVAKYDVAPRPFSRAQAAKGQEGNVDKLKDEGTIPVRGSRNRNSHPNALKGSEENSSGGYSKLTESNRNPTIGLNRKLYERKDNRKSSTVQVNVKSPLFFTGRPKSVEYPETGIDRSSSHKNHEISGKAASSEDKSLTIKYAQPAYVNNAEVAPIGPSSTPSSIDVYESINTPVVTLHSSSPTSTAIPYISSSPYSPNLLFYPPLISTLAPVQHFEISTVQPRVSEVKPQPKQRHVGSSETEQRDVESREDEQRDTRASKVKEEGAKANEGQQEAAVAVSDGVAAATNFGSEENDELKAQEASYEIHEAPNERHYSEVGDRGPSSHEYVQQEKTDYGSGGDSHGDHGHFDGEKFQESKDDTLGESSHESSQGSSHTDNIHRNLKEDTGDIDVGGKGNEAGDGKFEEGRGTVRQEGHKEIEDEKGQKGYKSYHEHEKANKGHHDKERKSNYYDEEDGKQKEDKEEGGYHEEHEKGEKGEKQVEFDEKGEHQKGYSTKGQHSVHKKDEFEKRTEFFDESQDEGEIEKDGEFHQDHEMSKGGSEKVSHHDEEDHEEKYGKEAKHVDSKHYLTQKGHNINGGQDSHYDKEEVHGEKKSHHDGKNWTYKEDGGGGDENDHKSDH